MFQSTNKLAIVKPLSFGFDQNSAKTNCFQTNKSQKNLLKLVINEHLKLKQTLYQNNIDFEILNRIQDEQDMLDGKAKEEKKEETFSGFAERRSK